MRNRTYNPVLGRWIQRDPIWYDGGDNLYEYCRGRADADLDPLGRAPDIAVDPRLIPGMPPADLIVGPGGKSVYHFYPPGTYHYKLKYRLGHGHLPLGFDVIGRFQYSCKNPPSQLVTHKIKGPAYATGIFLDFMPIGWKFKAKGENLSRSLPCTTASGKKGSAIFVHLKLRIVGIIGLIVSTKGTNAEYDFYGSCPCRCDCGK